MRLTRNGRWSLAFADLTLLLLGFTALQGLNTEDRPAVTDEYSEHQQSVESIEILSVQLFEPQEAMITDVGISRLQNLSSDMKEYDHIQISLDGATQGTKRLDGWELSAARMASVGRLLTSQGIDPKNIEFDISQLSAEAKPQMLTIRLKNEASPSR